MLVVVVVVVEVTVAVVKKVLAILNATEMATAATVAAAADSPYFPEPRPCSSLALAIWAKRGFCDKCCFAGKCSSKKESPFKEWSTSTAIRETPTLVIPGNQKRRRRRRKRKKKRKKKRKRSKGEEEK